MIALIAEGNNNFEIAAASCFSEGRVKKIVSELLTRLELKDRSQLVDFNRNKLVG